VVHVELYSPFSVYFLAIEKDSGFCHKTGVLYPAYPICFPCKVRKCRDFKMFGSIDQIREVKVTEVIPSKYVWVGPSEKGCPSSQKLLLIVEAVD
jgi:hypothetical protein